LFVLDERSRRLIATLLAEVAPRVVRVRGQDLQVFRVPAEDLHPDVTVPALTRRVVDVSDRQRIHIDQGCRFQRVERVTSTIAVVMASLIALEATGVDGCLATPAGLLRRSAEQAAKLAHLELLLPTAERAVVRCSFEAEFVEDNG